MSYAALTKRLAGLTKAASPGPPRDLPGWAAKAPQRTVYLKAGRVTNIYGLGGYFADSDARLSMTLLSERGGIHIISTDAFFVDDKGDEIILANAALAAPAHEMAACVTALTELESGLADDCCAVFEEFDGMTKTLTREGEELLAKTRSALAALAAALGVSDE